MGEPRKKLPDPEAWGDAEIERNTQLLEAIDSGRTKYTGDPAVLETVRMGLQWRADQQAGDADALELPFSTWRAAQQPALPADAPLQPGEDPSAAPLARADAVPQEPATPAPVAPAVSSSTNASDVPWSALAGTAAQKIRDALPEPLPGVGDIPMTRDVEDFFRGAGQGATFRLGDEAVAKVSSLFGSPFDGERASGRGFNAPLMTPEQERAASEAETLRSERQSNAQAQERSPWLYGAGEVVSALPAAIATAPVMPAAAPWTAAIAPAAVQGAAMGYLTGYGGSEEDSRLSDAAWGLLAGAAGGAGGVALGAGAAKGAQWAGQKVDDAVTAVKDSATGRAIADWAGDTANTLRNSAVGNFGGSGRAQKIAETEGLDFVEGGFAEGVERLAPPERGFLGIPKPRTAADYHKVLSSKEKEIGEQIGGSLKQMDEQGVSAPLLPTGYGDEVAVVDAIDNRLASFGRSKVGDDDALLRDAIRAKRADTLKPAIGDVDEVDALLDDMVAAHNAENTPVAGLKAERLRNRLLEEKVGDRRMSASDLAAMKRSLERSGYGTNATAGLPAGVRREANRVAASGPRAALEDAAERMAMPETLEAYRAGTRDYPTALIGSEVAKRARVRDAASPSGVGGMAQMARDAIRDNYGADIGANTLRGVQRALTPPALGPLPASAASQIASPAEMAAKQAATQTMAAQGAAAPGSVWGALARGGQSPAFAQEQPSESRSNTPSVHIGEAVIRPRSVQASGETSTGHNLTRAVRNSLKAYPQLLGKYQDQLEQAADAGDPIQLSTVISDLQRTDPEFRKVVAALNEQEAYNAQGRQ